MYECYFRCDFRAAQDAWRCLCQQKKCDPAVGRVLSKSFHLVRKTTLRKEHGCVAEHGEMTLPPLGS